MSEARMIPPVKQLDRDGLIAFEYDYDYVRSEPPYTIINCTATWCGCKGWGHFSDEDRSIDAKKEARTDALRSLARGILKTIREFRERGFLPA